MKADLKVVSSTVGVTIGYQILYSETDSEGTVKQVTGITQTLNNMVAFGIFNLFTFLKNLPRKLY